jgi:hypothetical protein
MNLKTSHNVSDHRILISSNAVCFGPNCDNNIERVGDDLIFSFN